MPSQKFFQESRSYNNPQYINLVIFNRYMEVVWSWTEVVCSHDEWGEMPQGTWDPFQMTAFNRRSSVSLTLWFTQSESLERYPILFILLNKPCQPGPVSGSIISRSPTRLVLHTTAARQLLLLPQYEERRPEDHDDDDTLFTQGNVYRITK